MLGFGSPEELLALGDVLQVYAPEERERLQGYFQQRVSGGSPPVRYEFRGLRKDGRTLWLENVVRIVNWQGRPAILATVIDISERKRAEQALEEQRRVLQTTLDTIPHAVYMKDRDLRYRAANRVFCERFAQTPGSIVGKRLGELELPDPSSVAPIEGLDRQVLESGAPQVLEHLTTRDPQGHTAHFRIIKYPLRDETGAVTGLVGITEETTERVVAEQALRASERLLRTVIDTIPHSIFVKEADGRFRLVNRAFAAFYDRVPEQCVGLHQSDLPHRVVEPRPDLFDATDRQVVETGQMVETPEVTMVREGTGAIVRKIVKMPLVDEQGTVTAIVGISEDITERKRAEEEARANRTLLQTVFNLLPLWVFVKDTQRRFLMVNRQMAEDYALAANVHPGALIDLGATITEEERSAIYRIDQRVLDTGQLVEVPEVQITLPRGGTRLFRTVRMPLRDAAGAVVGIVGIAEDITERRRTEQAIQQAQKLESLGVLAGGIAHDFNNLLVSILGNASLGLLSLPPDSPALPPIRQIETAGQRAAELCRQMLAYSGKGSFEISSVNLNALIEEMTQLLHVSLARSIALRYDFDPHLPSVEVDATQIRQVVMNLVMNAAEAIGEKPGTIRVTTRVVHADRALLRGFIHGEGQPEGDYVCLEVVDSGGGIAPEMLGRIFDPFFTTKFTGRGLGLAAVLGIVRGHEGALQVLSEPDRGATFRLLLPAQTAPAQHDAPPEPEPAWQGHGMALVVDDQPEVRDVLTRMLEVLGFEVLACSNGQAALDLLAERARAVRVVFLDMAMPGLSGEQTLRRLHERHPHLPVVMVSGNSELDLRGDLSALGARTLLQKPFTFKVLSERLRAVLG
jgi:PAS domain S-box-containing protein